jgi:hypothetical protein
MRFAILCVGLAACSGGTPDENFASQGYQIREDCTTTTMCPGANAVVQSFSYVVSDSSDSNAPPPGGSAMYPSTDGTGSSGGSSMTGGGDTPTGSGVDGGSSDSCTSDTSCNPTCQDTGNSHVCGDSQSPGQGGCWVTGGGFIDDGGGHDSFGGNAMPMKSGTVRGEWEHQDHNSAKGHGTVQYIVCRHVDEPGPGNPSGPNHNFNINQAYFGGPSRWFSNGAWADGYWFDVMVEDHGEPGNKPGPGNHGSKGPDFYHYTIRQLASATQSGPVVYDTAGDLVGGNLQIHPANNGHPYTGGTLPSWVSLQP